METSRVVSKLDPHQFSVWTSFALSFSPLLEKTLISGITLSRIQYPIKWVGGTTVQNKRFMGGAWVHVYAPNEYQSVEQAPAHLLAVDALTVWK